MYSQSRTFNITEESSTSKQFTNSFNSFDCGKSEIFIDDEMNDQKEVRK